MTKGPLVPHSGSLKLSERDLATEMERLAIAYPRTDMDPRKWSELYRMYFEDLKHLTLQQLRDGSRRYRNDAANKFFPTPGQLRESCRNPFETKPRRYTALEDLPAPMPCNEAMEVIEKTRVKYQVPVDAKDDIHARKEEILARKPLAYVETPSALKVERMDALERRLSAKGTG